MSEFAHGFVHSMAWLALLVPLFVFRSAFSLKLD